EEARRSGAQSDGRVAGGDHPHDDRDLHREVRCAHRRGHGPGDGGGPGARGGEVRHGEVDPPRAVTTVGEAPRDVGDWRHPWDAASSPRSTSSRKPRRRTEVRHVEPEVSLIAKPQIDWESVNAYLDE